MNATPATLAKPRLESQDRDLAELIARIQNETRADLREKTRKLAEEFLRSVDLQPTG